MAIGNKSLLNTMMRHKKRLGETPMRELFAANPRRFREYSASACGILLDYSKNRVDEKAMAALFDLARAAGVEERRKAMWKGEHINVTEDRAVMHMALRYMGDKPVKVDGADVMPDVRAVLGAIRDFSDPGARRCDQGRDGRAVHRRRSTSASAAPTSGRRW
jgi:glucose-6-phosphate isomerase